MKVFTIWLLSNLAVYSFMAWLLMILMGVVHSVWPAVPTFSFWLSFLIMFIITVIVNLMRGSGD